MSDPPEHLPDDAAARRVAQLEERLARIEAHLGLAPREPAARPLPAAVPARAEGRTEEEMEFEVGQNWFALVGIVVLTIGAGFTLSLPYAGLPAGVPSLMGYALTAGLFLLARIWRQSFELVSSQLRGAGMALFYFATLRLYFPGARHLLDTDTFGGGTVLALVVAFNVTLALRRKSPWLLGLALAMGYATALVIGTPGLVLGAILLLAVLVVACSLRYAWPGLMLVGLPLGVATYLLWALNDPLLGRPVQFVTSPAAGPGFLLASVAILALGPLLRRNRATEDGLTNSFAFFNCFLGYGVFLLHAFAAHTPLFAAMQFAAFGVLLGLAVAFWMREHSRVSTFLYAMTGYLALSLAIIKVAAVPDVFVWLSLQSVVVVATAIWFRSRFIVVANFLIYLVIVLGYVIVAERESGISVGFGIVALLSARILNWQKERLELKTELMRNAYLLSAFVIFPYALYHLVPGGYVSLAWVGLALFYYALNLVIRSPKFRWMGHATLLLTTLYLAIVGTAGFEPVYRVLSFLALGTVLLVVSLTFTRLRRRQLSQTGKKPGA